MGLDNRAQNALLAVLGVVAIRASGFAIWSVRQPHPSLDDPQTTVTTPDVTTTGPTAAPDTTQTATPLVDVTDTTATTEDGAVDVSAWVDAWAGDDANLLVIGDGFSNLRSQWIHQWAGLVAAERPVEIRHWAEAADVTFNDPDVLSEGDGSGLTIWNASRRATSIEDAAERTDTFLSEASDVDAVLVSLGRSSAGEDVDASLDLLMEELGSDLPVLAVTSPASLDADEVSDGILTWAQDHEDRVAVVDLRESAPEQATAEQWADAFHEALQSG
ncbi:hypothetical protein MWU75_11495 [Ornithinimicrobium sp. F0845]|uniref:hypothetical protein n=1 Tax=Ornithinimicrobium sp. F0845 TaxID=2926412 RepID=UPI001FF3C846|nr:hypothetical protein [Ornithinimicrobium sp. F0845]MCK0112764.1 hypothetical protein [Ornithinimicrobium sp. F0845]